MYILLHKPSTCSLCPAASNIIINESDTHHQELPQQIHHKRTLATAHAATMLPKTMRPRLS
jgi:hypothetical protein